MKYSKKEFVKSCQMYGVTKSDEVEEAYERLASYSGKENELEYIVQDILIQINTEIEESVKQLIAEDFSSAAIEYKEDHPDYI